MYIMWGFLYIVRELAPRDQELEVNSDANPSTHMNVQGKNKNEISRDFPSK